MTVFKSQQTPLPTPSAQEEYEGIEESIKIERNTKGYNWSFRLKREPGERFDLWVERCVHLDTLIRDRFA